MSNHQAWGKEVATGMPKVWLEFESHNWIFLMSPGDIPSRFRDTRTAEKKIQSATKTMIHFWGIKTDYF